jgi:hypothetical protein
MKPDELAEELGISGKTVRAFLRERYRRGGARRYERWYLTEEQIAAVRENFARPWRAPSREDMVTLSIAIPERDHRRLVRAAERKRAAIVEVIREAVREWLGRNDSRGAK